MKVGAGGSWPQAGWAAAQGATGVAASRALRSLRFPACRRLREGGPSAAAPPSLPPYFPSSLTYRPMWACRRRRFRVQAPPERPWKRRPAGSTSGPAAPSLAVLAGRDGGHR